MRNTLLLAAAATLALGIGSASADECSGHGHDTDTAIGAVGGAAVVGLATNSIAGAVVGGVVGGAGTLAGSLIGPALLTALPQLLNMLPLSSSDAAPLRQIIYGALLIGFMLWRPQGLLGRRL